MFNSSYRIKRPWYRSLPVEWSPCTCLTAWMVTSMFYCGLYRWNIFFSVDALNSGFLASDIINDAHIVVQNGVLRFCGFQVLAPQIFWSPAHTPADVRQALLDGWKTRLQGLLNEKPLSFTPTELFDLNFQAGFRIRPEVKEEYTSKPYGLTTGHHLGKALPPSNQTKAK